MANYARFRALKRAFQREVRAKIRRLKAYRRTLPANRRKDVDLEIAVLDTANELVALTFNTRSCRI